jgi:hypothetical protein
MVGRYHEGVCELNSSLLWSRKHVQGLFSHNLTEMSILLILLLQKGSTTMKSEVGSQQRVLICIKHVISMTLYAKLRAQD